MNLIGATNGRKRREGDIGQRATEGPVSDRKATFDDAALTGSFCPIPDIKFQPKLLKRHPQHDPKARASAPIQGSWLSFGGIFAIAAR